VDVITSRVPVADWVMPAVLSQPMPRKVSMEGCLGGFFILFAIMAGMIVSLILVITAASSHKMSVLEQRGVEITGNVFSEHAVRGKNNSYSYFIDYRFDPPELSGQVVVFEGDEVQVRASQYYAKGIGDPIAVIYDPERPDRSMLLAAFNAERAHSALPLALIASAVIGVPMLVLGGLYGFYYQREKHVLQWGKAVPAEIIGEQVIETRSGRVAKVRYSFQDQNGVTRENTRSLPVGDDPRGGFKEERARYLNNPTAIFDSRNSKRNVLFPGTLLQLDG
jgi:hypothetical protein